MRLQFRDKYIHSFGHNVREHYDAADISSSTYNWKKCVFNLEINISTVLAIRMSSGNSFHVLTVAMLNARSPYVMSFFIQ